MSKIKLKDMKYTRRWYEFLRSLETEGGSVVVLILLILVFVVLAKIGINDAAAQIPIILGAILGILKGMNNTKERRSDSEQSDDDDNEPKLL
jgi:hypothetical protein